MGRAPCCDKAKVKRGPWSPEEDMALKSYIERQGSVSNWIALPHKAGLKRCGKSCRLRWLNYLRPDIKHGGFTEEEDNIIFSLYNTIGSRWSVIASHLPGRTDNDIKNHWNTKLKKKLILAANSDLNSNISTTNNRPLTANYNSTQENFEKLPVSLTKVKTEDYGNPTCFDGNSATLPLPLKFDAYPQNFEAQNPHPVHQFPLPKLLDISDFGTNNSSFYSVSASQDVSSVSGSSSLILEDNVDLVFGNGGGGGIVEDAELDMGVFDESPYDFLDGFGFQGFQQRSSQVDTTLADSDLYSI